MAGEGNERGSSTVSFPLPHTGLDFVPIDPPYQEISSREEALLPAHHHAAIMGIKLREDDNDDDDDDERVVLPIPHLSLAGHNTFPSRAGRVTSLAVAVKKLETKRYGGPEEGTSADDSTGCVICIQDYEVGDEISVVPCSGRHRFHHRCLGVWLMRKHLCPLCRHTLPAELQHGLN
ncbi:unnamed protein product [Alopecurus aequalis]